MWKHQRLSVDFFKERPVGFDASDPGTGKTRVQIEVIRAWMQIMPGRWLIVCPKTLMYSAWAVDIEKYAPELTYSLAYATTTDKAFAANTDAVIINTDGVKRITPAMLKDFKYLTIDEITTFKNPTSQRSKAMAKLSTTFGFRYGLTGTPNPISVTELWHPMKILDGGKRLGPNYWKFRSATQVAEQVGPSAQHLRWTDRPGASEVVAQMIEDITVRHQFEDVMTHVPPNHRATYRFQLEPKLRKLYNQLERDAVMMLESGKIISGVNAATMRQKLLQVASGAVYRDPENDGSDYEALGTQRYELVADLVEQQAHSVVFFNWRHQREQLVKILQGRKISHAVIDGSTPQSQRDSIVKDYQAGRYQTILLHPRTGAHGLTLTRGTACIFASPIYEADLFKQAIHRIYRGTQSEVTNTILIEAEDTVEKLVYARLAEKEGNLVDFLAILRDRSKELV